MCSQFWINYYVCLQCLLHHSLSPEYPWSACCLCLVLPWRTPCWPRVFPIFPWSRWFCRSNPLLSLGCRRLGFHLNAIALCSYEWVLGSEILEQWIAYSVISLFMEVSRDSSMSCKSSAVNASLLVIRLLFVWPLLPWFWSRNFYQIFMIDLQVKYLGK